MNKVVIGLGSNIKPQENIDRARKLLGEKFQILAESAFITTKPVGYTKQANFINGALLIETPLSQEILKNKLKNLEIEMGREASAIKFGPRSIDMDIVVFNGQIVDKDFYARDFLKKSVLELIPDLAY